MPAVGPFVDSRLPGHIESGAQGGPTFNTGIQTLDSGYEKRNINWSQARAKYDVSYGIRSKEDFSQVLAFFYARRGRAVGFRFKDWTDFQVQDQLIATGTAGDTRTQFQIFKRYESGGYYYDRTLYKLATDTVVVRVNGAAVTPTVNLNTGIVTLAAPLAEGDLLTVDCEFEVPVRFDIDELSLTATLADLASIPSITLIELKDYESHFGAA